ncbi:RNA helicase [Enterobacter cancerogenus]|uniref:RNA helicase n=1 Tax=Enterobacter cancerogenus TaxID=69218 RepID=A0A484Z3C2_9ENTR|nr:RNA helicase [Enterobacter cancerogenus]
MALGLSDVKAQMAGLVYRGFVTGNGFRRLGDTLRYLNAIEKRLEKMAVDPHRDRAQMLKVESVQQAWQQWLNKLPPARRNDEDVQEIRWMIEELRVKLLRATAGDTVSDLGQAYFAGHGADFGVNISGFGASGATAVCFPSLQPSPKGRGSQSRGFPL